MTGRVYDYPTIGAGIPRLRDIRIIVYGASIDEGTGFSVGLVDQSVILYADNVPSLTLYGVNSTEAGVYSIVSDEGVFRVLVEVEGGTAPSENIAPIPVEPCTVVWIPDHVNEEFISNVNTGTGLGFTPGSGLTVVGTEDRVFSGHPIEEGNLPPSGLFVLNGHSTRHVDLRGSMSVQVDVTTPGVDEPGAPEVPGVILRVKRRDT